MSKLRKNYPDPLLFAKTHGADACRLYFCNSPLSRGWGEPIRFSGEGAKTTMTDILLPWFNSYRYCI